MIILQSILVFVHMCLVPYLTGVLFLYGRDRTKKNGIAYTTAVGLMLTYALYEVLTLSAQQIGQGFRFVSYSYLVLTLMCALGGGICLWAEVRTRGIRTSWKSMLPAKPDGFMIAAFVFVLIQLGAVLLMATPDMDDAFYSGLSSMSLAYDYLLEFDAYGGRMAATISRRYMVSALPIYQASLSLFSGMHHLTILHNLFPLFYIPFAYALFYGMGKRFLEKEGLIGAQGKFLFSFTLLHMIGNYYVFSPENFLVTRIWQGKALFVAIGIPMLWMSGQQALFGDWKKEGNVCRVKAWILVAAVLLACTFMGETGLFLGPFMLGCQTLAACVLTKRWKDILPAVACCIPEVILFALYLL